MWKVRHLQTKLSTYIRKCLKEVLILQLDLQKWQTEAGQLPAALVLLWWWTDEVSTTLWLVLYPALRTSNLAWKRLLSNKVLLSVAR